jgi:hypothetical protein
MDFLIVCLVWALPPEIPELNPPEVPELKWLGFLEKINQPVASASGFLSFQSSLPEPFPQTIIDKFGFYAGISMRGITLPKILTSTDMPHTVWWLSLRRQFGITPVATDPE